MQNNINPHNLEAEQQILGATFTFSPLFLQGKATIKDYSALKKFLQIFICKWKQEKLQRIA